VHAAYLDGGFQVLPSIPNIGPMIGMINLLFLLVVCRFPVEFLEYYVLC
jgi:hypothetical protein